MKNKLISIIVPVYNVEKYIEKCTKSLMIQDYPNIEIIILGLVSVIGYEPLKKGKSLK